MEPLDYRSPAFVSRLFAIPFGFGDTGGRPVTKSLLPLRQDSCFTNHIFMSVMLYTLCPKAGYMFATDTRIPVSKDVRRDLRVSGAGRPTVMTMRQLRWCLTHISEKVD